MRSASKKPFAWSISALKSFETCPKKHAHLRIIKDVREPQGEAAEYGKHVHKALELYLKKGKALPRDLRHLEKIAFKYKQLGKHRGVELVAEQQLTIDSDFQPTGWFDNNAWCRAMLDVTVMGKKTMRLTDWKTGKQQDDGFLQLRLCAAMMSIVEPEFETFYLEYVWLKAGGKTTFLTQSKAEINDVWAELLPRVRAMEEAIIATDFPARPSGLCKRHCPVTGCPHHGM